METLREIADYLKDRLDCFDERLQALETPSHARPRKSCQYSKHCRWFTKKDGRWRLMVMLGTFSDAARDREKQVAVYDTEQAVRKAAERWDGIFNAIAKAARGDE